MLRTRIDLKQDNRQQSMASSGEQRFCSAGKRVSDSDIMHRLQKVNYIVWHFTAPDEWELREWHKKVSDEPQGLFFSHVEAYRGW